MTDAATLLKAGDFPAALDALVTQLKGADGPALKDAVNTLALLGKKLDRSGWRAASEKLAKDPHLLKLYQIDEIVRTVRNRFKSASQQPNSNSQATLATATSSFGFTIPR